MTEGGQRIQPDVQLRRWLYLGSELRRAGTARWRNWLARPALEHDEGDTTKIKATVAAACAAAGTVRAASGVAAWVSVVIAGVGVAVSWLIGLLDDEHIADQTFVFTRQVVENNAAKVGNTFDVTWRFTDGDGGVGKLLPSATCLTDLA